MGRIRQFYDAYFTSFDKVFYLSQLIILCVSFLMLMANYWGAHYEGVQYAHLVFFVALIPLMILSLLSMTLRTASPLVYRIIHSYSQYWFVLIINTLMLQAIQYTNFPPIDRYLMIADNFIYFDNVKALEFTHQYNLHTMMMYFYDKLSFELFFLPGIALFFISRGRFCRFLLAFVIAIFVGEMIYYFFPTLAPASIYSSSLFPAQAHQTHIKFYDVHHYIKFLYPSATGGLIAFPSPHVTCGVLFAYIFIDKRWVFPIALIFNVLLIISTVLLGWHYLIDLIAAVLITLLAIMASHRIVDWTDALDSAKGQL